MSEASKNAEAPPPSQPSEPLALFDFDGTLTTCDSMWTFLYTAVPRAALLRGLIPLLPELGAALCGLRSRSKAKEHLLAHFFAGWPQTRLEDVGEQVAQALIPARIRPGARDAIQEYLNKGFRPVIVSASADVWIKPCARLLGVEALCTGLEFRNGIFTGHFSPPNCIREEKVRRVKEAFPDWQQRTIHAYGDSNGDAAMLAFAEQSFYRPFREGGEEK